MNKFDRLKISYGEKSFITSTTAEAILLGQQTN